MNPSPAFVCISAQALNERLREGDTLLIVDTLSDDHFQQVHLPGARNACVFQVTFLDRMTELAPDRDAAIVVYGSRAETSLGIAALDRLGEHR